MQWPIALMAAVLLAEGRAPVTRGWTAGAVQFALSDRDFRAARNGKIVFSARERVGSELAAYKSKLALLAKRGPPAASRGQAEFFVALEPLSAVGTLVSLRFTGYRVFPGASRDSGWDQVVTRDLAPGAKGGPGRAVSLLDLWSEPQILRGLLADPSLQKLLPPGAQPRSLGELWKASASRASPGEDAGCEQEVTVGKQILTTFAFHHLEAGKVVVRAWLRPHSDACRGQNVEIALLLPVPERLRAALSRADRLEAGFLMKSARELGISPYSAGYEGPERTRATGSTKHR